MARNVGFQCKCCIAFVNRESLGNSVKHYHKSGGSSAKQPGAICFQLMISNHPSYNLIVLKQAKRRFFSEGEEEEGGSSRNNFLTFCI